MKICCALKGILLVRSPHCPHHQTGDRIPWLNAHLWSSFCIWWSLCWSELFTVRELTDNWGLLSLRSQVILLVSQSTHCSGDLAYTIPVTATASARGAWPTLSHHILVKETPLILHLTSRSINKKIFLTLRTSFEVLFSIISGLTVALLRRRGEVPWGKLGGEMMDFMILWWPHKSRK